MNKNAILLITRNSAHVLTDFFKSYDKWVDTDKYDLYVYDNGSREGDRQFTEYLLNKRPNAALWQNKNMLFTYSANSLLRWIGGKEVFVAGRKLIEKNPIPNYSQFIIVNPDIEFTENWDRDLDNNSGIMGFLLVKENGIVEHYGGFGNGEHHARGEEWEAGKYTDIKEVDWVTFGCVAINSDVIEKCGVLDENYPHFGSDREFCKKAKENGFKIVCSPMKLKHGFGFSTRPYVINNVPDDIWKKHVAERRSAGVNWPENQADVRPYDQTVMARRIVDKYA